MKAFISITAVLCVLLPGILVADSTAPSTTERPAKVDKPSAADMPRAARAKLRDFAPSEKQIEDAEAFYAEQAPNFFKAYHREKDEALKRNPKARLVQKWLARNHADLKAVETADPQLYQMKLEQLRIEDKIMGMVGQAKASGKISQPDTQAEIRGEIQSLLESRKAESRHRIDRLQALLDTERQRLADMTERAPGWVELQLREEVYRGGRFKAPIETAGPTTAEN